MKLKAYHSIIIFAILLVSAIGSSVSSYRKAQYAIVKDMNQALAQTLEERQDQWITPDTILSYRSHLSIDLLKNTSFLCYAVNSPAQLCSRKMELNQHSIQGYANCSMADILGMSNQRTPMSLLLMAMIWGAWTLLEWNRKEKEKVCLPQYEEVRSFGCLSYSAEDNAFYNTQNQQAIHFTPMQHQLMQMFWENRHHQLSKQEICDALWPKKPDASETLYTLIRRIKPIIENNSNLMIESERGKAYRLTEKQV